MKNLDGYGSVFKLSWKRRQTTSTAISNAGVEPLLTKLILEHANTDITERVYTNKTHKQLVQAIDKILV